MTPQRALFRQLMIICSQYIQTYDFLVKEQVPYPFCYIGESTLLPQQNSDLIGRLEISIHLFAKREQGSIADTKLAQISNDLMQLNTAFGYHVRLINIQQNSLPDNTDAEPLIHYILDCGFSYTKKER